MGRIDGAGEHEHGVDADEALARDPGAGGDAESSRPLGRHHEHGRGAVGDLRGRARGVDAVVAGHGLERRQLLERRLAQALVAVDDVGLARGLALVVEHRRRDRDDLALEPALAPGPARPLLGLQAEGVALVATDAPLVGDALGPLELRGGLVLREIGLGEGPAGTDAAGDDDVGRAGGDECRPEVGGLLRRAALAVDGGGGDRERQPGREPRRACDVERLLADLGDAAAHDLVDLGGVDARPLDDGLLHGTEQVRGVEGGEPSTSPPDGAAGGFDDDHVGHASQPRRRSQAATGGAAEAASRRAWRAASTPLRPVSRVRSSSRHSGSSGSMRWS